jgi:hypothetical protein
LLAHIVINDKMIGEGLQVGVTEDSDRKQDYEHQVRSGRPVWPLRIPHIQMAFPRIQKIL